MTGTGFSINPSEFVLAGYQPFGMAGTPDVLSLSGGGTCGNIGPAELTDVAGNAVLPIRSHNDATMKNRALLLDPNRYSTLMVQGYSFSLNAPAAGTFLMGTAAPFNVALRPNSKIRPKRMVSNISQPLMITLSAVRVANVNVLIDAPVDAFIYGPNSFGIPCAIPVL